MATDVEQLYLQVDASRAQAGLPPLSPEQRQQIQTDLGIDFSVEQNVTLESQRIRDFRIAAMDFEGGAGAGATVPGEVSPVPTAADNLASAAAEQTAVNTAAENLAAAQAENARLIAEARAQNALLGLDDDEALARQAERRGGTPSALLTATKTTGLLGG